MSSYSDELKKIFRREKETFQGILSVFHDKKIFQYKMKIEQIPYKIFSFNIWYEV